MTYRGFFAEKKRERGCFEISRNKIFILGLICALIMCISGIYAFTNISILSVNNEINTGVVKIELKQYSINSNGTETTYNEKAQTVLPGEVISLIPRVSNLGDDCYIRAKFSYIDANNVTISVDDNINMDDEKWIKCGEYWYFKPIIKSGENIDLFKTLKIPTDMPNKYQNQIVQLNITTEAVQSNNFNPNFDSNSPWEEVSVKKATNNAYKTDKVQLNSNVKVEYENNADMYINVPDDFFGKLGHILPGDSITQQVTIKNTSKEELEYQVFTNTTNDISGKSLELLKKINITINAEDKKIYDGSLYKIDNCSLGKYKPNETSIITFTINIPKEFENEYSALNTLINWKFSVIGAEKVTPPEEEKTSPKTGDTKFIVSITMFFISTIVFIITLIAEKRTKNRKNK